MSNLDYVISVAVIVAVVGILTLIFTSVGD